MAVRDLPGLGLRAYWDVGSAGWDAQHDPDIRKVSVFCQCRVLSRVTALPGSPADGDIYIVPSSAGSFPDEIAVRDNGSWVYFPPFAGLMAYVEDELDFVVYDGTATAWVSMHRVLVNDQPASFLLAATAVCGSRLRTGAASANTVTVQPEATVPFPIGYWVEIEQAGTGQTTVVAGTGVTVNTPETLAIRARYCVVKLMKVGADMWTLSGDLDPV